MHFVKKGWERWIVNNEKIVVNFYFSTRTKGALALSQNKR